MTLEMSEDMWICQVPCLVLVRR